MNLFIVESPGKKAKIQSFLGDAYRVEASVGHVRDLPEHEMGVAPPDFVPQYVASDRGREVLARLGALAQKADLVYLATDPDREGEAIAWHLEDALKLKGAKRVTYTEITEKAIREALGKARPTDMKLVSAQEGRRVLDRLVGYMTPSVLPRGEGGQSLSAGRVQSPALRLVVEREAAIRNFKQTTHFGVELSFDAVELVSEGWKAVWNAKDWLEDGQEYFLDKAVAEKIAALRTLSVASYEESENKQAPPAPFTTSTLQQAASNALKFNPKKTMDVAQALYVGGLITYMRTDSPNLSEEAIADIRALASKNDWPVPPKPRVWKSKEGAQEAHEAIRPTHFEAEKGGNDADEAALYKLIRLRALASQLEDAVYAATKARLETDLDGKKVAFEAKGRRLTSPGWRVVLDGDQADETKDNNEAELDNPIPKLREGAEVFANKGEVKTKKTSPPARFSEASLVRELEKRGIGRPSTYAAILDKIINIKPYIKVEKRQLVPTALGEKAISVMVGKFGFLDYDFTRNMEEQLDKIAEGQTEYLPVVREAYAALDKEIQAFAAANCHPCPDCGRPLRHYVKAAAGEDKGYDFWGCPGFKDAEKPCDSKFTDDNGQPGAKQASRTPVPLSEFKCPDCGRPLRHQVKPDTDEKKGYNFWSCSGFNASEKPCDSKFADDNGKPGAKQPPKQPPSKFKCGKCKKPLFRRQGVSQFTGKEYDFFACSDRSCNATFPTKDGKPDFDGKK